MQSIAPVWKPKRQRKKLKRRDAVGNERSIEKGPLAPFSFAVGHKEARLAPGLIYRCPPSRGSIP